MSSEIINYYFEDFCFEAGNERLLRGDSPVSLTAKAIEILHILIQSHGRFVRKEEIIERVWSDNFVEEANLTQQIYVLRKTLGPGANGRSFIETLPKKGYRFTAQVSEEKIEEFHQKSRPSDYDSARLSATVAERTEPAERFSSAGKMVGYSFDNFRLDLRRRLLYQDDQPIPLPSKAFDTLVLLVENSGRMVTKNELMDKVWQARFVEENNLTQKIFILRRVLGDDKNEHQYIVTVPGEGYIFVAPVATNLGETHSAQASAEKESLVPTISTRTPGIAVAVLPFKTFAMPQTVHNEEFLAIGLADTLVSQLSRYQEIVVRPTSSILKFYNQEHELAAASRDLQATHLVEGIIHFFDSKLRISVQLYRSETGGIVWADDFLCDFDTDLLKVQNQISDRISRALALKFNIEPLQPENSLPKNFEAFQEYIKGKFHWNTRTIEGLKKGILHAQNALAIEPTFAMAYVGLADCYNLLAGQHSFLSPADTYPKAKAAAERALEISGGHLAEAYTSLAFSTFYYERDRPLAEGHFRRAIELKPNYPTAHHWYGEVLAAEGRFDESIAMLKKAQELDPLSAAISADLAHAFMLAGRLDESRFLIEQISEINPRFVRSLYLYGLLYEQLNEFGEAVKTLRRAAEIAPDEPTVLAELGCATAYNGDRQEARQVIKDLEAMGAKRYVSSFLLATVYLALNNKTKAFELLDTALQNRDVWLAWINVLPKLDNLRADQRFISFAAKIRHS
jgi:DNA-binding winged helix-turn-helix (wHTH) protein/tetratricopeptide (TPR) repeat protein